MVRLSRLVAVLAMLVGLVAVPAAARAADATFGDPTATSVFGESVTFEQPVTAAGVRRAEILVSFPGGLGPLATEVTAPSDGSSTLRHALLLSDGHLLPNTHLSATWRLTFEDGSIAVGPEVEIVYADDRFDWQTVSGDLVRVHWYEGDAAFGRRALRIGEDAIAKAEDLLGVTETEPVDFFVYADQTAFYDALGPGTRENVGGQANADIRTLFALITPAEIDDAWVGIVIPHELTHLVFDTAVDNPYHFPPRWLNEGLAVYLSQGYDQTYRVAVRQAVDDGDLIPLVGLAGQFPTTRDGFYLAYGESVSAIDYLVRTYGEDAMVTLIRSYAEGRTDDEAFSAALGTDLAGFEAAWFADLGAEVPSRVGPQPDPPGPLPPGWTAAGESPTPSMSAAPTASATASPGAAGGGDGGSSGAPLIAAAVVVGLLAVAIAGSVVVGRQGRSPSPAAVPVAPDAPGPAAVDSWTLPTEPLAPASGSGPPDIGPVPPRPETPETPEPLATGRDAETSQMPDP